MDGDHFLHLTDLGREVAEDTYEKHRFFTDRLIEAGVDPETAERDACRIEHVISKETFERLKAARKLSEKTVIIQMPRSTFAPCGKSAIVWKHLLNDLSS